MHDERQRERRGQDAHDGSRQRKDQALGDELRHELARRRAERRPDGNFTIAGQRPCEQERRHVQAPDHEQQPDRAEEHHERRPVVAELVIHNRNDARAPALVRRREVRREPLGQGLQLRLRLARVDARLQPRDGLHEVRGAAVLREVPAQALPHIHVSRIVEVLRHDADHRERRPAQPKDRPDDGRIRAVAGPPEPVADDGDGRRSHEERPAIGKALADLGPDAEHREQVRARLDGADSDGIEPGVGEADVRSPPGRGVRERRQRAVVHEIHRRQAFVREILRGIHLPQHDELIGGAVRERSKDDGVHDRVHGGGGAGAEAEDQHGHEREGAMLSELTKRHAKGVQHVETPLVGSGDARKVAGVARVRLPVRESGVRCQNREGGFLERTHRPGAGVGVRRAIGPRRQYRSSRCTASSSMVAGGRSTRPARACRSMRSRQRGVGAVMAQAYLTPATWPIAATKRAQSSRCDANTRRPDSVSR